MLIGIGKMIKKRVALVDKTLDHGSTVPGNNEYYAIGNQGNSGAEIPVPVDLYVVPANKKMFFNKIVIKNISSMNIACDIAILGPGVQINDQNSIINDLVFVPNSEVALSALGLFGANNFILYPGERIVVFPSSVDPISFKIYGKET